MFMKIMNSLLNFRAQTLMLWTAFLLESPGQKQKLLKQEREQCIKAGTQDLQFSENLKKQALVFRKAAAGENKRCGV